MPKLLIDGQEIEVEDGLTLIQACELAGVEIPRFCYHERLSIAGNCRMCLVEVAGMPKPVASCHMSVNDLRLGQDGSPPQIMTSTPTVKKAREGVMEFLLINHPLDCPICDQGGECDLQDQAMAYGVDASRFALNKRAVEDKNIGPLIKTIMTRCIHCTRCVRFMTEVAGVEELGAIGRGEDMEITTYLERGMTSELSGNVIDLCPVGALTSKPYAFTARPWELRKTESVDAMDAVGSNICIDSRGREVLRVLPRNHDDVNEEWISDKTRFIWDGLRTQRLDRPFLRRRGRLEQTGWDEALNAAAKRIKNAKPARVAVLAGDLAGAEELFALQDLSKRLGVASIDCRPPGSGLDPKLGRASYLFNTTIAGIDQCDAILLIGTNPRAEASVINARIRQRWLEGGLKIGLIGERANLTYQYDYLGAGPQTLADLTKTKNGFFRLLKSAKRPMIVLGEDAVSRPDGKAVLALAAKLAVEVGAIAKDWMGFNVLHAAAGRVAALELGFVPSADGRDTAGILDGIKKGRFDVVYLLGVDELDIARARDTFFVYQGSHGDSGAHMADVIFPGAAYTEKSATYLNTEGRPQVTARAVFPPGEAREDWTIIRALSENLDRTLPYDTRAQLRAAMYEAVPHFAALDQIETASGTAIAALAKKRAAATREPFVSSVHDFYLTNPIARASAIMGEMSALIAAGGEGATGTDG